MNPMRPNLTRQCKICEVVKPIAEFPTYKKAPRACKACRAATETRRRADPAVKQRQREVRTEWYYQRGGAEIVRKNVKTHRARTGYPGWSDPAARQARIRIQSAIRRGDLKRQSCVVCGEPHGQAHHDDYNKPLDGDARFKLARIASRDEP